MPHETRGVEVRGIAGSLGYTSGEFEPVRAAFDALLAADSGYAAQLAVYCGGDLVVDLCGGAGIRADSLIAIASCTKGAAYVCTAMLVQDGVLDLDQRVAHYWPQFGAGKDLITVRQLLSHQGGLIGVDGGFTLDELYDDRQLAARLAVQRPLVAARRRARLSRLHHRSAGWGTHLPGHRCHAARVLRPAGARLPRRGPVRGTARGA